MAGKGGARPGAGRKADPARDLKLGAKTAQKFLDEIKHVDELKTIYRACGDARVKTYIIMRMREWAYGKAPSTLDVEGGKGENKVQLVIDL